MVFSIPEEIRSGCYRATVFAYHCWVLFFENSNLVPFMQNTCSYSNSRKFSVALRWSPVFFVFSISTLIFMSSKRGDSDDILEEYKIQIH